MGECILHGNGGSKPLDLNFKVVGGTSTPTSPKENTVWVNTDTTITGWHFGPNEPNVYDVKLKTDEDIWKLFSPCSLHEGDIINFTIPKGTGDVREAIRICDNYSGMEYFVRNSDGSAVDKWGASVKVGVQISNDTNKIGSWGNGGTAYLKSYGSYYHEEGMLWIETGTSSPVEFNALKMDSVRVCPLIAKQYIGGTFVKVPAESYQGGSWKDWITYLFDNGDQCSELTGGWSSTHQDSSEWNYDGNYQSNPDYGGGAWVEDDDLRVCIRTNTSQRLGVAAVGTKNKVDLTPYKKIKAVCNLSVANPCYIRLAINGTLKTPQGSPTAYVDIPAGDSTVELDVSNISGAYHVILGGMNKNSENVDGCDLLVYSVTAE